MPRLILKLVTRNVFLHLTKVRNIRKTRLSQNKIYTKFYPFVRDGQIFIESDGFVPISNLSVC